MQDFKRVLDLFRLGNNVSVIYPSYEMFFSGKRERNFSVEKANKADKFQGDISHRSAVKIKKVVEVWENAIKQQLRKERIPNSYFWKYMTFVTLTLSSKQQHSDNEIKRKCLNNFLVQSRRKFGVKNYLWRAEPQKNGNIHFHVLYDRPIDFGEIRDLWNSSQEILSYVSNYQNKHGNKQPNSTDIHSLRNVQNVAEYIGKYMTKEKNCRNIEGRLWSCNRELKEVKAYGNLVDSEITRVLELGEKNGYLEIKKKDYAIIILGKFKELLEHYSPHHRERISLHNQQNFDYLYKGVPLSNYEKIELLPHEKIKKPTPIMIRNEAPPVMQLGLGFN